MTTKEKFAEFLGIDVRDFEQNPASTNAEIEAALCDMEEMYEARLADIENALCDLDGGDGDE